MSRHRNINWNLGGNENDHTVPTEQVKVALLMDIRDELQSLNRILGCSNFLDIPRKIDRIVKNTDKRKPKLKVVKPRKAA